MGAWGIYFDECDGALDFLGDVEDSGDWGDVERRIAAYVADGGYEEADEALAAAELVAAALGRASPRLTPELTDWARRFETQAQTLRDAALAAVNLISSTSELSELWGETDEAAAWQATVADLKARLAE